VAERVQFIPAAASPQPETIALIRARRAAPAPISREGPV